MNTQCKILNLFNAYYMSVLNQKYFTYRICQDFLKSLKWSFSCSFLDFLLFHNLIIVISHSINNPLQITFKGKWIGVAFIFILYMCRFGIMD